MQGDHPPWAQGILRRNVLFHCCNCLALCTLTVTTAQLIRGYLLHCCNITLCINLYISPISERAELNLHVSGFLARKKKVCFHFWEQIGHCLAKFWMCWFLFEPRASKMTSLKVRLGEGCLRKSQVKIDSNRLKWVWVPQINILSFRSCPDSKDWGNITWLLV